MNLKPHKEPIRIGAEIFIEPGQSPEEIDNWFKVMKAHGMTLTRIRMFESYMHFEDATKSNPEPPGSTSGGTWDFRLFDYAFKAGEKHGVAIYANLFPATDFSDVGGFKFPKSQENLDAIANYIKHLVQHFSQFQSLYGWVPINEPGSGELPRDEFTLSKSKEWKLNRQKLAYDSHGFRTFEFVEQRFLIDYNTWFLQWLCQQIRQYDPVRPMHVNNHDLFRNAAEYDFPAWRSFLTTLGGTAHVSWHFTYFDRQQYAMAMSANSEMLRSGAGPIPWMMTELQGGNNTYSGKIPMCPTKEEIAQWLWINIGAQSRGALFWCLNPRRSGLEAGEWALLDFQDNPSDRMLAAAEVAHVLQAHDELFDEAACIDPWISIVYTRESIWIEKALQTPGVEYEGRKPGGAMKSALAYFEALSEMGVHAAFKEIREYDFDKKDFQGCAIILANQISLPHAFWTKIDDFVAKGGTLILDGMTAYLDENAYCILGSKFPFTETFGATIREFKLVDELFDIQITNPSLQLKAHLWKGLLTPVTAETIATLDDEPIAVRNSYKKGKVVWLPMQLGIGARISKDYRGISQLLTHELGDILQKFPIRFRRHIKGMLMKVLRSGPYFITVLVNKSGARQTIELAEHKMTNPVILYNNKSGFAVSNHVVIDAEETLVIQWNLPEV